jgi:hypothetical protein
VTLPNFFIIGAHKAGTTSLYHYLNQHPQIYMSPIKEPFFFNNDITPDGKLVKRRFEGPGHRRLASKFADIEKYRALYRGVKGEKAIGEASPLYIYAPGTPERIKRHVPEARAIALLRNPADRAYSAFLHAVRGGREPVNDFAQVLREEEGRIRDNWHYVFRYRAGGFYYERLKRYYEVFGRERVGVWLSEDLRDDPASVTQDVFRFLEVDEAFAPDTSLEYNLAGAPRSEVFRGTIRMIRTKLPRRRALLRAAQALRLPLPVAGKILPPECRVRQAMQTAIFTEPPPIDPEIRRELIKRYTKDILKLQDLIGRDLSRWLSDEPL